MNDTMGNGGLTVRHGELEGTAAEMKSAVQAIDRRFNELEGELKHLKSDWVGDAQRSYTQAKATWDTAILEMKQLLDDAARAVMTSNDDYRNADKRGAAAFDF